MMKTRRYSELITLPTFEERFEYLKLEGHVGYPNFGFQRYINQNFYSSYEWKKVRNEVILRDNGCDLGIPGREISVELLVHHMNPMVPDDIINRREWILYPDFLITTTKETHNAIHYGSESPYPKAVVERQAGDTKLW